jgi:hypothetical protein
MKSPALAGAILALAAGAGCYGAGEVAPDTAPAAAGAGAGAPGSSGPTAGGVDVFGGATTCTSGQVLPNVTGDGYSGMDPGQTCVSCHKENGGPSFVLGGTVYPTGHEPDNCAGVTASDIKVVVTDANGTDHALTPNSSGNFYLSNSRRNPVAFAFPYTARVERGGKVVEQMGAAQTSGDCNSCHTETGANGAPGRIAAPAP